VKARIRAGSVAAVVRYVIIGAGAIGGGLGGRLHQAGRSTVLVARGDHLAVLRDRGLRMRTPEEDLTLPVPVAAGPDDLALQPDDVLVLATKTQQAPAALVQWADVPVAGGGTAGDRLPIITATNGVAAEAMALRYFSRVYGACVWMWAAHLTPGEVVLEGVPRTGVFHLGRVPAAPTDGVLERVREDWTAARMRIALPADVLPWKYRKLLSNIGNAFQALLGRPEGMSRLVGAAEAEGRAVLDAAGIAYTSDEEEAAARADSFEVRPVPGVDEVLGGSTWQSLTRGTGNVETDYLNGELVRIARWHGGEAPINATMAALVRQAAARGHRPGDLTLEQLSHVLSRWL
jgi:2-dehydropantoate 2-reductase